MSESKIRAWELIQEDDGSETLSVEYVDGTREEFRGVSNMKIEEMTVAADAAQPSKIHVSIPLEFFEIKNGR